VVEKQEGHATCGLKKIAQHAEIAIWLYVVNLKMAGKKVVCVVSNNWLSFALHNLCVPYLSVVMNTLCHLM